MAKFKVTIKTSDLTNVTVSDETTGQTLPPMAPPNTNVVAVVEIVQDTAFGGCWWVHQATINEWWGWQGVCPPQPEIVVRIDGQGSIKDVRLDGQKLKNNVGAPAQPSVRQRFTVEADPGITTPSCRYIVVGGKAYRIC